MEEDLYGYDEGGGIAIEEEPNAFANAAVGFDPRAPNIGRFQPWDQRAPQLNVPEGEVDWDYVRKAVAAKAQTDAMNARRQAAQARIHQEAVRFAGQRKMQELIDGGATPREAARLAAPQLFYQDPKAQVSFILQTEETTPQIPKVEEIDGLKMVNFGNRYQVAPGQSVNPKPPKQPRSLNQIEKARMDLRIKALQDNEILKQDPVKQKRLIDETLAEYEARLKPETTQENESFFDSETVKVIHKDGRKGTIPKSKLEAALKAGFKLSE